MPSWKHSFQEKPIDKLYVLDGCQDGCGQIHHRVRQRKHDTIMNFVEKDQLKPDCQSRKAPGCNRKCCRI